jgi:CDP-diacylglycerol--glycerol-3-phosphate 3-phosphatidyltransferase
MPGRGLARQLPNALSTLRLLAVPLLLWLALAQRETAFASVLIAALLSDIADGWIARRFSFETPAGAFLDTVADSALLLVSVFGIWVFHREVFTQHALICATAVGLWTLENVLALIRYRRLSSFHTILAKVTANLLGLFIGVLFVVGFQPWMLWLAAGASILTSLEEIALLAVLPDWRRDVRGLWWVLRERAR